MRAADQAMPWSSSFFSSDATVAQKAIYAGITFALVVVRLLAIPFA